MQNRHSNSIALPERRRFMPAAHVALFGVLMSIALMAVYPGQRLEQRMASSAFSDALSIAYLEAWVRAEPGNALMRLLLTRRQMGVGRLADAENTLGFLLRSGEYESAYLSEAEALKLELLNVRLWQYKPGTAEFAKARQAVLAQMKRIIVYFWDASQLQSFAAQAVALGAPDQALIFYRRLLQREPYEAMRVHGEIARLQMAQGHYREAANTYFLALKTARGAIERRQLLAAGLAVLQAGNLLDEAMREADARWPDFADDAEALELLARLARAANRMDRAEFYVSRLLRQRLAPDTAPPSTRSGL